MRIAVFEYEVVSLSPIGSCLLPMLRGLCHEHEFVVFAAQFENPCPEHIHFVRIPTPTRPLAFLFLSYHLLAGLYYWAYCLYWRARFDVVMMSECNLSFGDVSYVHFCHRGYLKHHWQQSGGQGLRRMFRWLDHWLRACVEPWVYRRVPRIVVPSLGLAREIAAEYPFTRGKIHCISNPIDIERLCPPEEFNRGSFRQSLRFNSQDIVLVFIALGHFERKGLPLLFEALTQLRESRLKLIVVGGEPDLVTAYRTQVERIGLDGCVVFAGIQRDIRPFLWGADAFVLPSAYETFSLVAFEAAAARLPLIVTQFHGTEEFFRDGMHGLLVEHSRDGVCRGLQRFLALPRAEWRVLGEQARREVARYNTINFVTAWRTYCDTFMVKTTRRAEVFRTTPYRGEETKAGNRERAKAFAETTKGPD